MANEFETKLVALKKLTGTSLETSYKVVNQEIDKLAISTVRKQQFKDELAAVQKLITEAEKARHAEQAKMALEKVAGVLEDEKQPFLIATFENLENKALTAVMTHIKSKGSKAALLISVDHAASRVSHQCFVPKVGFKFNFLSLTSP